MTGTGLVCDLIARLDQRNVCYCHLGRNHHLAGTIADERGLQAETLEYFRQRHEAGSMPAFSSLKTVYVNTNQPIEAMLDTMRQIIWGLL